MERTEWVNKTIGEWIDAHPGDHLRVILYEPAPDVIDENGNTVCGGEGTSTVVFDSTVAGDFPFDLIWRTITTINEGDDGIPELEFIVDDLF